MREQTRSAIKLLEDLTERAKELTCLYAIEEALKEPDSEIDQVAERIIQAIPPGWQFPEICVARISLEGREYQSENFQETPWKLSANIVQQDHVVGTIAVYYTRETGRTDGGPFLKEEKRLIQTIADRLNHFLTYRKMNHVFQEWQSGGRDLSEKRRGDWEAVLDLIRQTDNSLFLRICNKMLNHLCWSGIEEAEELRWAYAHHNGIGVNQHDGEPNAHRPSRGLAFSAEFTQGLFRIASDHLSSDEILSRIQMWIQEDKLSFLVQVVNRNLSLSDVADAIRRYHHLADQEGGAASPNKRGIEVSLIRRLLSDQLPYINVAKNFIEVRDFYDLLNRVVFSSSSHGKLGGKSAGLYLAAQILRKKSAGNELLAEVRVPRTWYVTSDMLLHFMHYNDFDEVVEQKYKPLNQVRFEYPHIVQTFKSAQFPSETVNGLSVALDEFGERPLIVRSSSLLEDRVGAAFSGKYRSLFLANQGSKGERLAALLDAIAEVYASTFGPDPIEYRTERGLIDFGEEMGIMIQEVVGSRVGKYFLPTFAGVAFSNNEYRWSPRIEREDGLLRLVPGLGTRAVDRLSDDYPVLLAPGKPSLRVNASPDEVARYSPRRLDVINLGTNQFETIELSDFLRAGGTELPGLYNIVSLYRDRHLRIPSAMRGDLDSGEVVVTFDGLVKRTPFSRQVRAILDTLRETLGVPVDIEFASDGKHFYLLQCRSQNLLGIDAPAEIPRNAPRGDILFTADKYVGNGRLMNITHIVYVDPQRYGTLTSRAEMLEVGRAIGRLNELLPRRRFVLIGPGRWGSRGDIRLGVSVTYADISNAACLIEIARRHGNYIPDVSFGTHFFQDLVETGIKYLPLYPDEEGIVFNERFLLDSENILTRLAPEFRDFNDTIRVMEIPSVADGKVLNILMNADLNEAMGLFEYLATRPA